MTQELRFGVSSVCVSRQRGSECWRSSAFRRRRTACVAERLTGSRCWRGREGWVGVLDARRPVMTGDGGAQACGGLWRLTYRCFPCRSVRLLRLRSAFGCCVVGGCVVCRGDGCSGFGMWGVVWACCVLWCVLMCWVVFVDAGRFVCGCGVRCGCVLFSRKGLPPCVSHVFSHAGETSRVFCTFFFSSQYFLRESNHVLLSVGHA